MSDGSQGRRTVRGLALVILPIALAASGCEQIPIPRANAAPIHIPPPNHVPEPNSPDSGPVTSVKGDERELLPPLPSQLHEVAAPSNPLEPSAPIDEALTRTQLTALDELPPTVPAHLVSLPDEQVIDATKDEDSAAAPPAEQTGPPGRSEDEEGEKAPTTRAVTPTLVAAVRSHPTAERPPIDPEKRVPGANPAELWSEGLDRLRKLAGEQEKAAGESPGPWPLRARLLDLIEQADRQQSQGERPLWKPLLAALADSQGHSSADPLARAAGLRAAITALENEAPLEIGDLRLCRKVKGFGNFEPIEPSAYRGGQPLIGCCEMSGVRYIATGEMCHSRLSARVELVPVQGGEPAWSQDLGTAEDVCRHPRRDYYVNYRIVLPESVSPGQYQLKLTQRDELAGRTASASLPVAYPH